MELIYNDSVKKEKKKKTWKKKLMWCFQLWIFVNVNF